MDCSLLFLHRGQISAHHNQRRLLMWDRNTLKLKVLRMAIVDSSPTPVLEEAPKKSYASIVKVMKENAAAPFLAPSARPAPVIPPRQTPTVATSSPAPEVPASSSHGAESGDVQEAEVVQPEEEFKRFGPIRPDGIQVRSNKAPPCPNQAIEAREAERDDDEDEDLHIHDD
ncbi:hypothetical protein Taro_028542 [Colocasia esculenta]|uniref:Uncharacterized protein n=1 Tax=Colocasia esculenta TaxID=4460 RepID=A0A843VLD7_COLES|nr:hypothetical protein [Colocasia esculenta]